jgi:hypothetical protein
VLLLLCACGKKTATHSSAPADNHQRTQRDAQPVVDKRRSEVVEILSGRQNLENLPLVDTDPEYDFDPKLRERIFGNQEDPINVRIGKLHTTGAIPEEVVRRRAFQFELHAYSCFKPTVSAAESVAGWIDAKVIINAEGKVKEATLVDRDLQRPNVVACTLKKYREDVELHLGARRQNSAGETRIEFAIAFTSTPLQLPK